MAPLFYKACYKVRYYCYLSDSEHFVRNFVRGGGGKFTLMEHSLPLTKIEKREEKKNLYHFFYLHLV